MNKYKVHFNSRDYEVNLIKKEAGLVSFEVDGHSYTVEVSPVLRAQTSGPALNFSAPAATPRPSAATTSHGPGCVPAPIPGIIVDVLVKVGDKVKAGQNLAILEAMKMENNITAPQDGTVKKIAVKKSQEVLAGDALIWLE